MNNYVSDRPSSRVINPPGGASSNIFGGSDDSNASKVSSKPKPTYQSSIFAPDPEPAQPRPVSRPGSEPAQEPQKKAVARRDPITGNILNEDEGKQPEKQNGKKEEGKENGSVKETTTDDPAEPHLGPVKTTSGVRYTQPPGGKSSISFG